MLSPKPQHDPVEQLLDNAHACREELRKGGRDCIEDLKKVAGIENPSDPRFAAQYRAVLLKVGLTLFKASRPFLEEEWSNSELNFYFWPGYESLLIGEIGNRRLTLIESSSGRPVPCGVGLSLDGTPAYEGSNTSIWFERALTKCVGHGDHHHQTFVPGSTHAWISQSNLRVRPPATKTDVKTGRSGFLTALEISLSNCESAKVDRGILSIELDEGRFESWAATIARYLNGTYLESSLKWPVPLEAPVEKNNGLAAEIRLDLYNIWLAACFGIDWSEEWRDKVFAILRSQNLECLIERLNVPKDNALDRSPACRHWYTLKLQKTLELNGELQPLGSAMFLSSARLSPAYLYLASSFVNEMYFRMRDLESTIQARDQGQKEKEIQVLQKYKALAQELSQSLRSAANVYHRANREMMPAPSDLLDLYKPPKAYIPEIPLPYFKGRFHFRHDWFADKLNDVSADAIRRKVTETFRVQTACILLSYLGEPSVPQPRDEWNRPTSELMELLKKRKHELRVFEHLFGSTIAKITDEANSTWTADDESAFQRVLKGCFHYPFKNQRLTGPLLGLWVLERRTDLNLDEQVMSWLFGPKTVNGHGWPGLEALQAIYALYQEVIQKQPCGLSVKTQDDEGRLRRIEIELSSCSQEAFSHVKQFSENLRPDGGSLAEAVKLVEEAKLDLQTYPKGNVIVMGFGIA